METLLTVVLTLSITLNVVIVGLFALAYRQWKKGQKAKNDISKMFEAWGGRDNS